jgi:P-type Cu+ transporter
MLKSFRATRAPSPATAQRTLQIPVRGMDCGGCARKLEATVSALPGVRGVDVLLAAQRVTVRVEGSGAGEREIREAIERSGFRTVAAEPAQGPGREAGLEAGLLGRSAGRVFALILGGVLFAVVIGEWLGLFHALTERVPLPAGALLVLALGFGPLRRVVRDALAGRVTAHTLVSLGALAALLVGEWVTAVVVVVFMRVAEHVESFTASRGRSALRDLSALAPPQARVERGGAEVQVPVAEVRAGEVVVVRPGERIPVDGEVVGGHAAVDQAAITGEGLPVEAEPGTGVFAATLVHGGVLRIRAERVGADSTFGRVVRMVEEGEAHRAEVQRLADRFAVWYLPVVVAIALLTWLVRGDVLAMAAVLVVACSCAFALATPVAMIASIASGARQGLLVKGGRYLEALARADVLLLDKTGTLTLGRPRITDIVTLGGALEDEVLALAAAAERHSEHPLAEAVRAAAEERGLPAPASDDFEALPGLGVRARVAGATVEVGNRRLIADVGADIDGGAAAAALARLQGEGKSTLLVARDGVPLAVLGAADTLRPEVPAALAEARTLGIRHVEILSGDNASATRALADALGVAYRAELLPEEKIRIVEEYRALGHVVVMVGDGVNDALALRRADVGIAMGAAGTDVALEAAHLALMRDDWMLVPRALRIAKRTMGVVRLNIVYTVVYNVVGVSLAALGILPPILAAAGHSLPDLAILANSSRLLRQDAPGTAPETWCGVAGTAALDRPAGEPPRPVLAG